MKSEIGLHELERQWLKEEINDTEFKEILCDEKKELIKNIERENAFVATSLTPMMQIDKLLIKVNERELDQLESQWRDEKISDDEFKDYLSNEKEIWLRRIDMQSDYYTIPSPPIGHIDKLLSQVDKSGEVGGLIKLNLGNTDIGRLFQALKTAKIISVNSSSFAKHFVNKNGDLIPTRYNEYDDRSNKELNINLIQELKKLSIKKEK